MNCREAEHLIFAERDGALDEVRRGALVSHVGQCHACGHLRTNLTVVVNRWREAAQQVRTPDADLEWQKLRREIRGGAGSRTAERAARKSPAWFAIPLAAAAAIAVALVVNYEADTSANGSAPVPAVARATNGDAATAPTVVYVDDKSGWTFVVAADEPHRG